MSDFETDLDKFNLSIQSIINSYDGLDTNSPITPSLIDSIREITESNYHLVCETLYRLNKVIDQNTNAFQNDLIIHNKNVNELNKEYQKKIARATQDIQAQIDSKKNSIKEEYVFNKNKNDDLMLDTETFINSSNLNIDMLRNDAKNDIAKYTYQYSEAKYTYAEDAESYNDDTFKKLAEVEATYKEDQKIFVGQIDTIANHYIERLKEIDKELDELRLKHTLDIRIVNEEKKKLSIELNDKIKQINNEHSNVSNKSKMQYQQTQMFLLKERQSKKNVYLKEAQDSNKEFITNAEKFINKFNEDKKLFNEKTNETLENNYYDLFLNHKEEEKKLHNFYKNNSSLEKNELKKIKHIHHKYYLDKKKQAQNEIKVLENEFNKKVLEFQINKAKNDAQRQAAIKKYNENELKDNKYYQEKNNQADQLSLHEISLDLFEVNKVINRLRHESNIKIFEFEAKADEIEAVYLKNNERLLTEKRKCQLEIQSSKKLKELVQDMLLKRYNKEIMHLRITGALHIERCRKLLEYNERQLDIYTKISNSVFDYSQKKIELQNDARRAINECKKDTNNIMLDLNIMSINNNISILGNSEQYESRKLFKEFSFKKEKAINTTLRKRFTYEIKDINHYTSTLLLIFSALENTIVSIVNLLLNNEKTELSNFEFITNFIRKIKAEIFAFTKITITNYKRVMIELIDQTIKFENEFKFEASFNSTNDHFNEETLRINNNINDTVRRIDDLKLEISKENKTIQSLLFGIKNDKSASKVDLSKQIQTLKKDISNKNKLLKGYNESIKRLTNDLRDLNQRHEDEIKVITTMQKNNTISLYKLHQIVIDLSENILQGLDEKFQQVNRIDLTFDNYKNELFEKYSTLKNYINSINIDIYKMIKEFKKETLKYHKADENTLNSAYSSSIKELAIENNKNLKNQNQRFVQELNSKNRDLNIAIKKENNTQHLYNTYNKRLDNQYALSNKETKSLLITNEIQLYREINAINQNILDIKNDYITYTTNLDTQYKFNRKNYFRDAELQKENYDVALREYIVQRDNDIKRLPDAVKSRILMSSFELKDRNKEVDLDKVQEIDEYSIKLKRSKAQIDSIMQNYNKSLVQIEKERKEYIKKVKKPKKA